LLVVVAVVGVITELAVVVLVDSAQMFLVQLQVVEQELRQA
jgi:hypothetical protein